jgi:hypothetical protein
MMLPCSSLYVLLYWSAITTGETSHEDCAAILLNYFPSNLCVGDLDTFCLVCAKWLGCRWLRNSSLSTRSAVLRRMIKGAKAIKLANTSSLNVKPCEGKQWIGRLWECRDELTEQYGTLFRELLHTLAECYCQHAFAGDQAWIRISLHTSLEWVHRDPDACEWPDCVWWSHECNLDVHSNCGPCALLPEYAADDEQAPSPPPEPSLPSPPGHTEPSSRLIKACQGIRANFRKLRCGTPAASPHDEEQGRGGGDIPLETLEPNPEAASQDPDPQTVRTPFAEILTPSTHQDDNDAVSAATQSLAYGTQSSGDETSPLHELQCLNSGTPSSSSRWPDQADEAEDQSSLASVRPVDPNSAASPSGCGGAGEREPCTPVSSSMHPSLPSSIDPAPHVFVDYPDDHCLLWQQGSE